MVSGRVGIGGRASGQASLLRLGVLAALVVGVVVLFAFGSALGSKGRHQRGVDLAAVSAAQVMRDLYPRLFEAPLLANGLPNHRHLPLPVYLARARAAALRGARRNGIDPTRTQVTFGASFAPTRVEVRVQGEAQVALSPGDQRASPRRGRVPVTATAAAEIAPDLGAAFGQPAFGSGGGYDGPLAYRMGKPMRPEVALAFDRTAAAARREAGLSLYVNSGFRSDAEQARLFAAKPTPHLFSAS